MSSDAKEFPISTRFRSGQRAVVETAAAECGTSRAEFIRDAALQRAARVLHIPYSDDPTTPHRSDQ